MRIGFLVSLSLLSACSNVTGDEFAEEKQIVARDMKDPLSAQFRDVERHDGVVCGEANGKNSYGAYAGFQPFYVKDGVGHLHSPTGDDLIDATDRAQIVRICSEAVMSEIQRNRNGN